MSKIKVTLAELREMWDRRRRAAEEVRARIDPTGMTKPARDPEEAAFLRETGQEGPFVEVDLPGWREWVSKRDKPARYYSPFWHGDESGDDQPDAGACGPPREPLPDPD